MNNRGRLLILSIIIAVSLASMNLFNNQVVITGNTVKVEYQGWINDHYFNPETISFVVGNKEVIKGLDSGVLGMSIGETRNLTLPPIMAYGTHDENNVFTIDKQFFIDNDLPIPIVGSKLEVEGMSGVITIISDDFVVWDTNHPLAGETINISVTILQIN